MSRRVKLSVGLLLGVHLVLGVAGQACGEFAQMSADCPMSEAFAMSEMAHGQDSAAATASHGVSGHARHAANAPEAAADPSAGAGCHEPGQPQADCCLTATTPAEVDALVPATQKPHIVLVILTAPSASLRSASGLQGWQPPWLRQPPLLEEPPRYALFSSYLL